MGEVDEASVTGDLTAPDLVLSPPPPAETLQVLADVPIERDEDDRLGFAAYADALAELLDHPATSTPLTIALTGPWGSGKTSLAMMVADRLHRWPVERGEPPHIVCWFNAWLHDDAPNLGAAFAAEVARVTGRHRPWWVRALRPLPGRMLLPGERWRRGLLLLGISVLPVVLVVLWSVVFNGEVAGLADLRSALGLDQAAGIIALTFAGVTLWSSFTSMADTAGRFFRDPAGEAGRGTVSEVRRQLAELVRQATGGPAHRRLVILVDDLERCLPGRAVEVCEKAYQLFGHRDVAVVLIADAGALAEAAQEKHGVAGDYGRRYLEKVIQIQFSLPAPGPAAISALLQTAAATPAGAADVASAPAADRRLRLRRRLLLILNHPWRWAALLYSVSVALSEVEPALTEKISGGLDVTLIVLTVITATLGSIALIVAVVGSFVRLIDRLLARWARARIDQKIEAVATGQETGSRDLADEVMKSVPETQAPLVENRVQRYLVDTSDARRQAEAELLRHPPRLPRDAKRMLNQLRVLLAVALRRNLLGSDPTLTAAHLGRWVVLQHRWPGVAHALTQNPALAARLETCSTSAELAAYLPGLDDTEATDALTFLHDLPHLSDSLDRLVLQIPTTT